MKQNIYSELGFSPLKELIFSNDVILEAKNLFDSLPLKNVQARQLVIEENLFSESFAISIAEDSNLTEDEAKKIIISPEIESRLKKYRENKTLSPEKKYRELEFENIKALEFSSFPISFAELNTELICQIHYDLTIGLDDYCKSVGHSRYHAGRLRDSNQIKVGKVKKYSPPDFKKINKLLTLLINHFRQKKEIKLSDIFEFHILFYAIHPFSNGNKRVARILESLLLHYYEFGIERVFSMSPFYTNKKDDYNFFLLASLNKKTPDYFVNFALRGYFYAGKSVLSRAVGVYITDIEKQFKDFIKNNIKAKYHKRFNKAFISILDLNGLFSHTEFIKSMKEKGISSGVSQRVILYLKQKKVLKYQKRLYFLDKDFEINHFLKKFDEFLLKHNIIAE